MHIAIAYALPHEQWLEELDVPEASTVEEVLHMAQVLSKYPDIDLSINKCGIFAKMVPLSQVLLDGQRIEIYRALPKKPRNAHAEDDKKERIRAKKERTQAQS
ncbi:MAG: RnfH family protein [Mariprofundaceae bacterium]|nr:RnfH family protein [Mariprofundaceae bacterium]